MKEKILNKIRELVKKYAKLSTFPIPKNEAPVSGKVYDEEELLNGVEAVLEGWWTEGRWNRQFEEGIKNFLNVRYALTVNSGSSANLVAFFALTSQKLGKRRIKKGDEVITVAAGFPTTVNPIIIYGAIPVFLDVEIPTYNIKADEIEEAITEKTKAIFLAHTLGNPFEAEKIRRIAHEHDLWLIEDNCDALGSKHYNKYTGTFGHIATLSFYPAHHITTGEGGAILTNDPLIYRIAKSIRDWGRDCYCPTGKDNTCGKRFEMKLGNLPFGYDHKYIYSEIGFNLKMTDLQAALGVAQLKKLTEFIEKRKMNFNYLKKRFIEEKLDEVFVLPEATKNSDPSWFGFPLLIKGHIDRKKLLEKLNAAKIGTRLLFASNLTKQPYFIDNKIKYKVYGKLTNSDLIMNKGFWIGVYPALEKENLEYVVNKFKEAVQIL